ncbi:hypothetical protein VB773_14760 [Haloarculaceae archaeon H-GB2-1]|nr:hypothetical protein [Haloarculaceae archaeon H-GB1-1]MEA5387204.1 hypothetical protein [Haloarculaceae archaeon H-GB11]MEA5408700.1 hypothetical protein [Haloarculaceae archaeon H-GB2-1]
MESYLSRAALFALYQFSLLVGIVMLPIALATQRFGVALPVHRLVSRLGDAYDETRSDPA